MSDQPTQSGARILPVFTDKPLRQAQGGPDISICIVNWNGREVLRNCLISLRAGNELQSDHAGGTPNSVGWVYSPTAVAPHGGCKSAAEYTHLTECGLDDHVQHLTIEVIVVDNASTDGSIEMMAADFPEVSVVSNTANRGFATANNQAAARATGRYLFFLNNDTIVRPESLPKLVRFLDDHAKVVAVGPKLIGSDGKPQRSARNLPTLRAMLHSGVLPIRWIKIFSRRYRAYRNAFDTDVSGPAPQLAAAALLVRPVPFFEAGAWDEAFEFGVEDVDLCVRLSKFGTIHYLPDAWITHLGRVSSHLARGWVFRGYQCGHVRYFRKHHRSRWAPLIYKIAITVDTPIRLLVLLCKTLLSQLTCRREEAARSKQRAAGVWFFICHGLMRFWRT